MPDPKSKIELLASSLEELRLHMGGKDLSIADQKVNAQLYFCLANACLRGHAVLLYGGMGPIRPLWSTCSAHPSWAWNWKG